MFKCPTQIIKKSESEQIRIMQKGDEGKEYADFRIWKKSKWGRWVPTETATTLPISDLIRLSKHMTALDNLGTVIKKNTRKFMKTKLYQITPILIESQMVLLSNWSQRTTELSEQWDKQFTDFRTKTIIACTKLLEV